MKFKHRYILAFVLALSQGLLMAQQRQGYLDTDLSAEQRAQTWFIA